MKSLFGGGGGGGGNEKESDIVFQDAGCQLAGCRSSISLSLLESFFHGMDDVRQHLDTVNSPTASETDVFSFKLVICSGAGKDSRSTVRKKSDVTCV